MSRPGTGTATESGATLETRDERDARIEARYSYDRSAGRVCQCKADGCEKGRYSSTLAYVAGNQAELALEYLDVWRPRFGGGRKIRDGAALREFEIYKFRHELEPGARGMLRYAILRQAFSQDFSSPRPHPVDWEEGKDYRGELYAKLGILVDKMTWPDGTKSTNYDKNERERLLREQAAAIVVANQQPNRREQVA